MKKQYVTPSVDITEVKVEKGFATSEYGEAGTAGCLSEGYEYDL